jgi:hypothetical protein
MIRRRWRSLTITILSGSSRRRVCDHAFADRVRSGRSGWTGQAPNAVCGEDRGEGTTESGVAVPEHKLRVVTRSARSISRLRAGLGGPCSGRVCAHPEQMCSAGAMLDCDQDLDPPEHDGVHGHEVHGEDGLGLAVRNWRQVGADRGGAGSNAGVVQNLPHRGGSDATTWMPASASTTAGD